MDTVTSQWRWHMVVMYVTVSVVELFVPDHRWQQLSVRIKVNDLKWFKVIHEIITQVKIHVIITIIFNQNYSPAVRVSGRSWWHGDTAVTSRSAFSV